MTVTRDRGHDRERDYERERDYDRDLYGPRTAAFRLRSIATCRFQLRQCALLVDVPDYKEHRSKDRHEVRDQAAG
jgi:hypothetical protein